MIHKGSRPYETPLRVVMSRCSGGHGDPYWVLTIEDEDACQRLVEARISYKEFSEIMGHCPTAVHGKVYLSEALGKRHEAKSVAVPQDSWPDAKELAEIYDRAEAEHPGWRADRDEWNGNRYRNRRYEVIMRRWVDK